MIRAVILDIDGVILGNEEGKNFPLPSKSVQLRLQNLSKRIPVSLCTVKAYFAVEPIVKACGLENNYHITDAGATLVKSSTQEITTTNLDQNEAIKLIRDLQENGIYVEWYSGNEYFSLPHENSLIRESRTKLFNREAIVTSTITANSISKIIAFPMNELQEAELVTISKNHPNAAIHWGINPARIPFEYAFFTHVTATKQTGAQKIAALNGIPLSETFAAGDSTNDWSFMELCGYKGTLSNGSDELKANVINQDDKGFVSEKSVAEDGILDALDHFNLV